MFGLRPARAGRQPSRTQESPNRAAINDRRFAELRFPPGGKAADTGVSSQFTS